MAQFSQFGSMSVPETSHLSLGSGLCQRVSRHRSGAEISQFGSKSMPEISYSGPRSGLEISQSGSWVQVCAREFLVWTQVWGRDFSV